MDTHPRSAKDAEDTGPEIADGDLAAIVRTIDPILLRMIDGVQKGSLGAVELIDIAVRIRTVLHDAVRNAGSPTAGREAAAHHVAASQSGQDVRTAQ
jgi:hypothetical protein